MRRFCALILSLALLGAMARPQPGGVPWTADEIAALQTSLSRQLDAPEVAGAQIGFEIVDTQRGTPIFSRNSAAEFMPASNMKLLTGSAALQRLGTAFRFDTAVFADARPPGGTIDGDLYLRGGGDAQLAASDLDAAAAALAGQGITSIRGSLVVDSTHDDAQRYAPGWQWDDIPYDYNPALSALELEEGVVHVTMTPAAAIGAPVTLRVWPQTTALTIDNRIVTGPRDSQDTSDIVRPWDQPLTIVLTGSYPLGARESDDLAPSVPDPAAYAGDVFARALGTHGIALGQGVKTGTVPRSAVQIWDHRSEALAHLLADMWIPSDNLMAELLLKELGVAQAGEPGSDARGIQAEKAYLRSIGVDPATVSITDGSGLSAYDRITPQALIAILQADWNGPNREAILDALPVAGVRGTLKNAYKGTQAEGAVFAKTGTWTHATTLSGYVETRTHGPVTFSLLINQWIGDDAPGGPEALSRIRGAILSSIASQ